MFKRKPPTSQQKGLNFEKRIVKLYQNLGCWNVRHDVKLRDSFGNFSQVDVTFVKFFRTFYVECKAYQDSVKLEEVSKFKEVLKLNNIPISRGIFITTSSYVPRAKTIGIKTIDGEELKILEKKAKGRKFKILISWFFFILPLICLIIYFLTQENFNFKNFEKYNLKDIQNYKFKNVEDLKWKDFENLMLKLKNKILEFFEDLKK